MANRESVYCLPMPPKQCFNIRPAFAKQTIHKFLDSQGHLYWGTGGARIALHTEFFPSLLSCEGAFSGGVNSLVQEIFSGDKPIDPQINTVLQLDKYTKYCSSEKTLKTKIYPCGGAHICIDVPAEEALPPALGTCRRPCGCLSNIVENLSQNLKTPS